MYCLSVTENDDIYGLFPDEGAARDFAQANSLTVWTIKAFVNVRRGLQPIQSRREAPAGSWAAFQALGQ
jgi:hypothetical protein